MDTKALHDDVARFFDRFVEAFGTFRGPAVATLYFVPGIALRADGSIQSLQARSEVERFFQAALDGYHGAGCRACRYKDLEVVPMGGRGALGTVTWEFVARGRKRAEAVATVIQSCPSG